MTIGTVEKVSINILSVCVLLPHLSSMCSAQQYVVMCGVFLHIIA
jgi:hypothetical protein